MVCWERYNFSTLALMWAGLFVMADTQSITGYAGFKETNPESLLPFLPNRITSCTWAGVSDVMTCARLTTRKFKTSRGFLFNFSTGLCSPLLWFEGPSTVGALPVQPEEGNLFLMPGICDNGFQILEVGTSGELVCLRSFLNTQKIYTEAQSHCSSFGAYLVSVKTLEKLELIRSLVSDDIWIGLDDIVTEGVFVWASDGETLTSQQITDTFSPGDPDNWNGNQDCASFYNNMRLINDEDCSSRKDFICEKTLPSMEG